MNVFIKICKFTTRVVRPDNAFGLKKCYNINVSTKPNQSKETKKTGISRLKGHYII